MENIFFKIKKTEFYQDINNFSYSLYELSNYKEKEIVYMKNAYDLQDAMEQCYCWEKVGHQIINKGALETIMNLMEEDLEHYKHEHKLNGDLNDFHKINILKLQECINVVKTIYKLFDFENYYLLYICIY